ncbi:DUF4810 domain-containing protein [Endozoicomonas sp. Mp262]|uniref:DUF4810 domain-containing protein n=1 Tax=Endozoicomonas sp. Mp262 TaxID=2919499 RepID=UPI0021D98D4D
MKHCIKVIPVVACLLMLAGCQTTNTLYQWGDYEDSTYEYYKTPAELETYIAHLQESIARAEQSGAVPPGLYAEYGTALLNQGKKKEALSYYRKESDLWPESRHFMNAMISNLEKRS